MQLKECLNSPCGLDYMMENLDLQSSCARQCLLETEFCTDSTLLADAFARLRSFYEVLCRPENAPVWESLKVKLMELKDIRHTLYRLKAVETLDDLELFEVKHLALLTSETISLLRKLGLDHVLPVPDVEETVCILDPEGLHIATFYVYDAYSDELAALRVQWRAAEAYREELFLKVSEKEAEIRETLCRQLRPMAERLEQAQQQLAQVDVMQAKVRQMLEMDLCFPEMLTEGMTDYKGLFHPKVKAALKKKGRAYQPVDIAFGNEPTLIVGANMGGKTVVLKCVALCQYLCQFGFGIPARSGRVLLRDGVCFCMGDHQSDVDGLSSFAAEIRQVDALIQSARKGTRLLALLDEPARSTNPAEGTALVRALLNVLRTLPSRLLLATHYSLPSDDTQRCLKVRGMQEFGMDYSLEEVKDGSVPHEALHMAEHLGADAEWLHLAGSLLDATM